MHFQIKSITLAQVVFLISFNSQCHSDPCQLPSNLSRNVSKVQQLADHIIAQKDEIFLQNIVIDPVAFKYDCRKAKGSDVLKNIDSICLANQIHGFYISSENDIAFYLPGESDFFKGQVIERQLFFSTFNEPDIEYEDQQIKNKCLRKISDKIWYIVDEISN